MDGKRIKWTIGGFGCRLRSRHASRAKDGVTSVYMTRVIHRNQYLAIFNAKQPNSNSKPIKYTIAKARMKQVEEENRIPFYFRFHPTCPKRGRGRGGGGVMVRDGIRVGGRGGGVSKATLPFLCMG